MEKGPLPRGEILLHYVKLRRSGVSRVDAVAEVKADAFQLPLPERNELGNDINQWEAEQQGHPKGEIKPLPQHPSPAGGAEPRPPTALGASLFGTQPLDHGKARGVQTGPELPILCPNCGKKNSASAEKCSNCGATLKSKEARTRVMKKPDLDGDAHPMESGRMLLAIKTRKQPLEVYITKEMVIGRSSPDSSFRPDIDLAPFDGEQHGVSRSHASLKKEGDTIVITDLESSNETHINGERLYPHETRVLRHGDEVQLGTLMMKVQFKK
jgi:hypothetical protein